nr:MAG TPA: hypothetical protein [Caudoviricetes sp.]
MKVDKNTVKAVFCVVAFIFMVVMAGATAAIISYIGGVM